jgi:hypothetical protein
VTTVSVGYMVGSLAKESINRREEAVGGDRHFAARG